MRSKYGSLLTTAKSHEEMAGRAAREGQLRAEEVRENSGRGQESPRADFWKFAPDHPSQLLHIRSKISVKDRERPRALGKGEGAKITWPS